MEKGFKYSLCLQTKKQSMHAGTELIYGDEIEMDACTREIFQGAAP